jgi:hypothetical protein
MASTKTYLARTMMSNAEIKKGISPFDSAAWRQRSKARAAREQKKRDAAEMRREEKKNGKQTLFKKLFK